MASCSSFTKEVRGKGKGEEEGVVNSLLINFALKRCLNYLSITNNNQQ